MHLINRVRTFLMMFTYNRSKTESNRNINLPSCKQLFVYGSNGAAVHHKLEVFVSFSHLHPLQVAVPDALCSFGGSGVLTRHCLSLLEAIEGLGQAGSVGQDVVVVVQRVYSIPVPDCSPVSGLKLRVPSRSSSAPPAEKGKTRYCWTS